MSWEKNSQTLPIPAKRYRIGELVRYTPFSRQTIHNYTIMGLIREAEWTEGGHRLYDESVFSRLERIMKLKQSMSLTEIRRTLTQEEETTHPSRDTGRPSHLGQAGRHDPNRAAATEGQDFMPTDTS